MAEARETVSRRDFMKGSAAVAALTVLAPHVLGGEGKITIGDNAYDAKQGSFYYMPAGQPHALESTDNMVFLLYHIGERS